MTVGSLPAAKSVESSEPILELHADPHPLRLGVPPQSGQLLTLSGHQFQTVFDRRLQLKTIFLQRHEVVLRVVDASSGVLQFQLHHVVLHKHVLQHQCCCQGPETQGRGLENWSSRILESRARTFLKDNNTAVRQYGEMDMNLTGAQWQISHSFVTQSLQDDGACYVSLPNPQKFSRT